MAAVEVTISGVLYDKYNRTQQNVVLIGEAVVTGLGVGGGPIYPPPGGGGNPPVIWGGGNQPFPTPPIHLPKPPTVPPPSIWPPGPGVDFPAHPIVLPPPVDGEIPPIPPGSLIEWKPVWTPDDGWQVIGIPQIPHVTPS